ncbi:histidine kinase [Cellulomonas sp. JH27-2]|uniref:sensor histidine kinase n=1 Tax=Cellulomonas sp. JH27-2 TaxID=2774139 RepID=UPI001780EEE4|nr:histidine kinase [Cellulomonas sp. JH27-2]MBD8058059.1 histidine kinase [Cellulomonas sp. JH27-2]
MTSSFVPCPPARPPLAVAVPAGLALALLTGLAAWAPAAHGADAVPLALDVAAGVVALVVLLMLPTWPVLSGILLGLLAAVSPAATPAATAGTLVAARWFRWRTSVLVALASVVGHAVQGWWREQGLTYGWWLLCDVAVHAALLGWGAYGRSRAAAVRLWRERARAAEREQAARVEEARVAERLRIAREMHDSLAHRLSLLSTTAGALEYRTDLSPEQVARAAGVVREAAAGALADLRQVVGVLRDGPDDLAPAPTPADVPALVERWRVAGMDVTCDLAPLTALPTAVGLAVYRVIQEGLTNVHRHAPGSRVRVQVTHDAGVVTVEVRDEAAARSRATLARHRPSPETDPSGRERPLRTPVSSGRVDLDGAGAVAEREVGAGVGLAGLRERVELVGGALEAGSSAGGFTLRARVPA